MTTDDDAAPDRHEVDGGADLDDVDDTPEGTDADFSGDTTRSLDVPEHPTGDPDFEALEANARSSAELAAFLSGDLKTIFVHKSHQYANGLNRVVGESRAQAAGRCGVGLIVPCRQGGGSVRSFVSKFPNTAIRFIDPEVHLHKEHFNDVSDTAMKHWPHLVLPLPSTPDAAWTTRRLAEQVRCGATVLLTPTGTLDAATAAASLKATMDHVALARSIVGDAPMFVNITVARQWLTTSALRDQLLEEIVDSHEPNWFVRVHWPIVEPTYGQLNDRQVLDGYKELVAVCADEDKVLVLPNSDLTGWVALALGANGFGTATSISDRHFGAVRIIKSPPGQPKAVPKKRYFSTPFIHTIEQPTHAQLVGQSNYTSCGCTFCTALQPDLNPPPNWKLNLVGYHYVHSAAALTAAVAPGDSRRNARRTVRAARHLIAALPAPVKPTGDDVPHHLDTWSSVLT